MDKLLRRVRMAEGMVARRAQRKNALLKRITERKQNKKNGEAFTEAIQQRKAAVEARNEDWMLGPLAPRRELDEITLSNGNFFGSLSPTRALLESEVSEEERKARVAWCGSPKFLCIAPGDRVVVIEGHHKDLIGTIEKLNTRNMTVEIQSEKLKTNTTVPQFMQNDADKPVTQIYARLPISSVRLVHPLKDPQTGEYRDVIIRELRPRNIVHDRPTRTRSMRRFVPGENIIIPWPKQEPIKREDQPADTLRIDVDEKTFVPTLFRPPAPQQVLDELRNKYSIFRTRHTPEYIAKKEQEEQEKEAKKSAAKAMLTPVQEYNRKQRELRRARGQPALTEEMLAKIGEVVARNKLGHHQAPKVKEETVAQIEKAVEQLSLGGGQEDAATTTSPEQPKVV
ncbi:hypothetical protein GE21DRAFT_3502 [Neurospora crassa]|uniref:Large ribosomal subunit protein uL24m n=2 Tax=Neurospora crassa TaxID=5141 RepID=RM40_NEUCR|nr:hypothetical protein NCU01485 [Neurospora crassa OR74A]Q7RXU7.2 RecName: Full=Large ribosomal subunit protein uL24m [Neurospora crassa OR74A]6YWE_Q Chain Q, KOW domain-containing protein [Neurospora crassa]6YWS_Q Chain Q, KOW domain-containing protein [Neurospora crassa OR74A]6YWV_Q Chain Q, KOW domain-containing protein [Neurospora crassa OR74A]6YWX_Q Chain Q, KOW domain-containing protein [Neurospora crassa OR74A]6YWY_Q Chain Q, KOW domain-containing protein [Neurospora crassa]EAA27526.|eukprot:XP_956762.2 hypothetical protein NCU01485 [Neurospora crassa OR74A]